MKIRWSRSAAQAVSGSGAARSMAPSSSMSLGVFRLSIGMPKPPGQSSPEGFRARGLTVPRHTVKSNSGQLFFSLVATGRFISALPASVVRLNGKRLGIKALPFEFPIRPDPICIATLKGHSINPASQLFIACARELSKQFAKGAAVK
jgi:DNA-binding transcriptional LysR family regulator